ncbi:MAG: hypothetical protein JNN10_00590 [Sphingopyxis sp.]|uniref:hypothetical protein n=1 Tax=Sphingopyxis sp. TaxID=1908224 RepID=UPI001A51DCF8|nr:hypothetical protein [Sphingopyxis sp.]MBL9064772.1 hypothetical protein [Sphingopyxis sp.]
MPKHYDEQKLRVPDMEMIFETLKRTFNARLKCAFPPILLMPEDVLKYEPIDRVFAKEVSDFFRAKNVWDISIKDIDRVFGYEILNALYSLSWEAKRMIVPKIMELSLENYKSGHIIIECSDNILLNPHESDDASSTFGDWVLSFSDYQRQVILDYIMIMRVDVLGAYRNIHFRSDPTMWIP